MRASGAPGHTVASPVVIEPAAGPVAEIRTAFSLMAGLAAAVRAARAAGRFPLVLAGNCNTSVGTVAGLGGGVGTAVLWFDAHGDFNTPETTTSGFLDGMGLATLTGRCWAALAASLSGFTPVSESNACLLGVRDLDPQEAEAIARSQLHALAPRAIASALPGLLAGWAPHVKRAYLHLDMDVLDPSEGRANELAAPDGVSLAELRQAVAAIGRVLPIAAATISAYDPAHDPEGRIVAAAVTLAQSVLAAAAVNPVRVPR